WRSADVANCANFLSNHWAGCTTWIGPYSIPGLSGVAGQFGATWYLPADSSTRNLLLVYRKADGTLHYQILDGRTGAWSGDRTLPMNAGVTGGPSIVRSPGSDSTVYVYAPIASSGGQQVQRWTFNGATGWATSREPQLYADGTPVLVQPAAGSAATL